MVSFARDDRRQKPARCRDQAMPPQFLSLMLVVGTDCRHRDDLQDWRMKIPDVPAGKAKTSRSPRPARPPHTVDGSNVPLLERDSARAAVIEPSRIIKPIDIAEHCVLCFFQEVIREVAHGGA